MSCDHKKDRKKAYNKEYGRKYMPEYLREQNDKIREEIHKLLGNKCANPYNIDHGEFFAFPECLQVDHVHGNGYEERHRFHSFYSFQKHILAEIKAGSKDYQLLCANCNWIKRWRNPNERRRKLSRA